MQSKQSYLLLNPERMKLMKILDKISSSADIKALSAEERLVLCSEIREFLVSSVSKTGGHLASNLGVVELTVALNTVFDMDEDKFIWDVGHQSYVHKLLTGRKERFDSLRKFEGMSGFPKTSESKTDVFNTGHSSTSISAALGIARARDLSHEKFNVGAIFGDGALTGGMMYEAMNDAGDTKNPLILILNDNNMSISKNVGSMSKYLRALRIAPGYSKLKKKIEKTINSIPVLGKSMRKMISKTKRFMLRYLLPVTIFENFGFEYLGPVDGHNLDRLIGVLELAKSKEKPVFVHIRTKKGKGYLPAEQRPECFHGVGPFNPETGEMKAPGIDYSAVFGEKLFNIALENSKVVGITAAMPISTGMYKFSKYFRDRFFDVCIAEQHAVTMAAGLATGGYIPVFPVYSSFMQRAYDQLLHDVCLQKLHVVFAIDRAGIVGSDGETHQGIYDIAFCSTMPNMSILSPSDFNELEQMLDYAINSHNGPIAIRYPRGNTQFKAYNEDFEFGKVYTSSEGSGITIYATGRMLKTASEVNAMLGSTAKIVAVPTLLPLDRNGIIKNASEISCVIEDGIKSGGLGSAISKIFAEENINSHLTLFGFPDEPVVHGTVTELDKKYGVDAESIYNVLCGMKG